jgi:hypothetical protein
MQPQARVNTLISKEMRRADEASAASALYGGTERPSFFLLADSQAEAWPKKCIA